MSESKHTPGPWKTVASKTHGIYWVEDEQGETICDFYIKGDFHPFVNAGHNAHLISAAPDLKEACAEFVRKVDAGEARSTKSYNQMKAALSKANGEK